MKVFTCNDHKGHWPVGASSVVVAKSKKGARTLLQKELDSQGLGAGEFTLKELDLTKPHAIVLTDGEY